MRLNGLWRGRDIFRVTQLMPRNGTAQRQHQRPRRIGFIGDAVFSARRHGEKLQLRIVGRGQRDHRCIGSERTDTAQEGEVRRCARTNVNNHRIKTGREQRRDPFAARTELEVERADHAALRSRQKVLTQIFVFTDDLNAQGFESQRLCCICVRSP